MAKKSKTSLPFDKSGGVLAIQRRLIDSKVYLGLQAQSKVLMTLLHVHWRNDDPVAYGVREAAQKIPCAKGTVQKAFKELVEKGFISMIDESYFNSRTQSKSRTWKLNWLPYKSQSPTNEWKKINSTVSNMHPLTTSQGQKCTF